jgi:hypothetical protein
MAVSGSKIAVSALEMVFWRSKTSKNGRFRDLIIKVVFGGFLGSTVGYQGLFRKVVYLGQNLVKCTTEVLQGADV